MPRCARHFPASGKQSFKYFGFDEYKQEPRPHPPLSLSSLQEKIEPGIFAIRFLFFYFRVSEFFFIRRRRRRETSLVGISLFGSRRSSENFDFSIRQLQDDGGWSLGFWSGKFLGNELGTGFEQFSRRISFSGRVRRNICNGCGGLRVMECRLMMLY